MSALVLNYSLWAKFTVNWPHPKFSERFLFPALFITHYENVHVHIYAFILQTASDI